MLQHQKQTQLHQQRLHLLRQLQLQKHQRQVRCIKRSNFCNVQSYRGSYICNHGYNESNRSSNIATNAATSATAENSKTAAEAAQAAAETAADNFDDVYLGAKSSDPTVDNDGDALTAGDLYFNTTSNVLRVYNGSMNDAVVDTTGFATMASVCHEYCFII